MTKCREYILDEKKMCKRMTEGGHNGEGKQKKRHMQILFTGAKIRNLP